MVDTLSSYPAINAPASSPREQGASVRESSATGGSFNTRCAERHNRLHLPTQLSRVQQVRKVCGDMADSPEVMNIRQAAEYLGVSADTLYKYVAEEKIPAFKLGNRWKFKKTILDSWMERQSSTADDRGKKHPRSARAVGSR